MNNEYKKIEFFSELSEEDKAKKLASNEIVYTSELNDGEKKKYLIEKYAYHSTVTKAIFFLIGTTVFTYFPIMISNMATNRVPLYLYVIPSSLALFMLTLLIAEIFFLVKKYKLKKENYNFEYAKSIRYDGKFYKITSIIYTIIMVIIYILCVVITRR